MNSASRETSHVGFLGAKHLTYIQLSLITRKFKPQSTGNRERAGISFPLSFPALLKVASHSKPSSGILAIKLLDLDIR